MLVRFIFARASREATELRRRSPNKHSGDLGGAACPYGSNLVVDLIVVSDSCEAPRNRTGCG